MEEQDLDNLFLSVVSLGELRKGIALRSPGRRTVELTAWLEVDMAQLFAGRILPLTAAIADRWGRLEARRQRRGRPLDVPDGQIAATAIEHELALVTRNARDFADLGAELINPWGDG